MEKKQGRAGEKHNVRRRHFRHGLEGKTQNIKKRCRTHLHFFF